MFTLATFTAAVVPALAEICPAATYRDAPVIMAQLAADPDCFEATADGIWFCCGNEDAYYRYGSEATAAEAAEALAAMFRRWQITYDPATGFSA